MINRRFFLCGASAGILAAVIPGTITLPASPYEAALDLIEGRIRETLLRVGDDVLPRPWRKRFDFWRDVPDVRAAIQPKIKEIFDNPQMMTAKEIWGPVLNPSGRMSYWCAMAFYENFALIPDRCDSALFNAFAIFAPPHLV